MTNSLVPSEIVKYYQAVIANQTVSHHLSTVTKTMEEAVFSEIAQRDLSAAVTRFPEENLEKRQKESPGLDTFEVTTRTETDVIWVDPSNNPYVTVPRIATGRIELH